jgi:hypothetical protein
MQVEGRALVKKRTRAIADQLCCQPVDLCLQILSPGVKIDNRQTSDILCARSRNTCEHLVHFILTFSSIMRRPWLTERGPQKPKVSD